MSELQSALPVELDHTRAFGWFSLLAGGLSILFLFLLVSLAPILSPSESLAFISAHHGLAGLDAIVVLTWGVFSVPFVVALGPLLRAKSPAFGFTATILSAAGILLLAFGLYTHVGAVLAIIYAGKPPTPADAVYRAEFWGRLSFYLADPGLMTWGLGQFLFGWLAWNSRVLPNWLAVVGVIGGLAGLLTLAVYATPLLAELQILCFAVWALAIGILLLRRQSV